MRHWIRLTKEEIGIIEVKFFFSLIFWGTKNVYYDERELAINFTNNLLILRNDKIIYPV
jgi:hypothetical protein